MSYDEMRLWLQNFDGNTVKSYVNTVVTDTRLPIYGIPMGDLRKKAKDLNTTSIPEILANAKWDSFEEVLVLGLVIAYAKLPFAEKILYIQQLLPHLDSWAHTDSIVPTFRIRQADRDTAWEFTMTCIRSEGEYTVRFGIVMLMHYFLDEQKLPHTLTLLVNIRDERYYVQMAAAWCLSEIAVDHFQAVEAILRSGMLDKFTHNKTIQKIRESYRIQPEQKAQAKALKRKE